MSKLKSAAPSVPAWAAGFTPEQMGRIVRSPEAARVLGISRTTLWRYEREGRVPRALKLSERAKGWRMGDLLAAFSQGGAE